MRRRKKKHDDEHMDESWLIPYADLLTLLLALFIVLYASSSVDAQKFKELSQVFNEIFTGGTGMMEYPSPVAPQQSSDQVEKQAASLNQKEDKEKELSKEELDKQAFMKDQEELKEIQKKINEYIKTNNLEVQFITKLTDEGLLLTIRDNVLFDSGSATVQGSDLSVAGELSDLLVMNPPRNIIISGHTDNVPIRNAEFESNWELSVMRAVNFMKIILDNPELDPQWFSAKGFGEFEPIADNGTAEGRGQNRRVEVLILPRVTE
ncbi:MULTISPECIES: flagellar motor protein MotB [Bacillaceae]|uniref:flagellar motor protein MotB n=1 Tax=Bacillaceae TaxID=186817 RepID=UPI001C56BF11|nr:flagellar motor protein MotB [Rossellomorea sp. YZS02]MBW3112758.1 flagellar motor protein MotB [Bacillus sp. MCCB 382]MDX8342736.1 flagellar motor protein MotB [Rossellomorea sp. YZS02]